MLTLKAATVKMLSEIPAVASNGDLANGTAAVLSARTAATKQTRRRADGAGCPRRTNRSDSQPLRLISTEVTAAWS